MLTEMAWSPALKLIVSLCPSDGSQRVGSPNRLAVRWQDQQEEGDASHADSVPAPPYVTNARIVK